MKKNKYDELTLKGLEKLRKPKLIVFICNGLIYIGPYLHLYLINIEKNYNDLLKVAILTGISLPLFTLNWVWYFYELKHYKSKAKEIYNDMEKAKDQNNLTETDNSGYVQNSNKSL